MFQLPVVEGKIIALAVRKNDDCHGSFDLDGKIRPSTIVVEVVAFPLVSPTFPRFNLPFICATKN